MSATSVLVLLTVAPERI